MNENPATLLEAHRRGEPAAADALARRALRIGLKTATGILRGQEQVRDIAQDIAIEVLRGAVRIRNPDTLDAWIHRIAVRHTMRLIGKHRQRVTRETPLDDVPEGLEPRAADSPYDDAIRAERAAALNAAIAVLPAKQRTAVILRYVHDLTHQQVADAMGIRAGTASALISRATATLRTIQALDDLMDREGGER